MTIVFICGSVEPGRDGVGDYTLRFARELLQQGHRVALIAINDRHVTTQQNALQVIDGTPLPVLRIPSRVDIQVKYRSAKAYLDAFDPGLVSLQFVPYAFQDKGLPFAMLNLFFRLREGRQWHIMFHETWIGVPHLFAIKSMVVATLQKFMIKRMLRQLNPAFVHATIPSTARRIRALGWQVKELPLFSNIPIIKNSQHQADRIFRVGFFSQVEDQAQVTDFLVALRKMLVEHNLRLEVLLIGGNTEKMQQYASRLGQLENFSGAVHCTGVLGEPELSAALQRCTIGCTPVPRHAVGKSSSIATFIAHKKAVAAPYVHDGYQDAGVGFFRPALAEAIITRPDFNHIQRARQAARRASTLISIQDIARDYINDFQPSP